MLHVRRLSLAIAICVLAWAGACRADSFNFNNYTVGNPLTAATNIHVAFTTPSTDNTVGGSFTATGNFTGYANEAIIAGTQNTYVGSFSLTITGHTDAAGNWIPTAGTLLEQANFGSELQTVLSSTDLLAFDHVAGTNEYQFAFAETSAGSFVQTSGTTNIGIGSIIAGIVFTGTTTAPDLLAGTSYANTFHEVNSDVKSWANPAPLPKPLVGASALLAGLAVVCQIRRFRSTRESAT